VGAECADAGSGKGEDDVNYERELLAEASEKSATLFTGRCFVLVDSSGEHVTAVVLGPNQTGKLSVLSTRDGVTFEHTTVK
jgi:hypothetical protein